MIELPKTPIALKREWRLEELLDALKRYNEIAEKKVRLVDD